MPLKNKILFILLSLAFINLQAISQNTSSDSLQRFPIVKKQNGYFINEEKIKYLKPYMMTNSESAYLYHRALNNSIGGITCLGIGLTNLLISLIPKSDNTRLTLIYTVNLPALIGMVYFGIEAGKYRKKAIAAYNKKVVM